MTAQGGDGRNCPSCARDIGTWAILRAGLPNMIRCPHCRTPVRYEDAGSVIAVLLVLAAGFGYLAYRLAETFVLSDSRSRQVVLGALLLAAWVPIELVAARFLRSRCKLVVRS